MTRSNLDEQRRKQAINVVVGLNPSRSCISTGPKSSMAPAQCFWRLAEAGPNVSVIEIAGTEMLEDLAQTFGRFGLRNYTASTVHGAYMC